MRRIPKATRTAVPPIRRGRRIDGHRNGTRWAHLLLLFALTVVPAGEIRAHGQTLATVPAIAAQARPSETLTIAQERPCRLHLELRDATSEALVGGLVRVSPVEAPGDPLELEGLFRRPAGWHSTPAVSEIRLPRGKWRIEATRGVNHGVAKAEVDLTGETAHELSLSLDRFYDTEAAGLRSANTHLHLILNNERQIGTLLSDRLDVDNYLKTVGGSDALDLVYVSRLERPGNSYVTNDYTSDDLARLSSESRLLANGVEHRHGKSLTFRQGGIVIDGQPSVMAYGHVLLLAIEDQSVPPSIGPGLTDGADPTDGTPLRNGIISARGQGGGVIWCHGTQGLEDVPNWVAGLLDAQNIYDGGNEGSFDTVFYPYLNAGFKVPFSTGTDWGIWDFSRVYVAGDAKFSSEAFLRELRAGRSYITNEPLLEFEAGGVSFGDTLALEDPGTVRIRGRAMGRSDFLRLQVVHDGRVVHEARSQPRGDHYEATVDFQLPVGESGWTALRIPPNKDYSLYDSNNVGAGSNLFGKLIFAHTSPVYLSVAGRPRRDPAAIEFLKRQLRLAVLTIEEAGVFRSDDERAQIVKAYEEAETFLDSLQVAARGN